MAQRFRHAALVGKYQAPGIRAVLEEVAHLLARNGLEVTVERDTAHSTGLLDAGALGLDELGRQCDLAVVVGGDGTMLSVARHMARHDVPLIGINQGRLGFITDVQLADIHATLPAMLAGDHELEYRAMLAGGVRRAGRMIFEAEALNDVVVDRGASASLLEVSITVQDELVANLRADGVIVSSATGSTAYALSAGGPIMHPSLNAWAVVPIAPHTLSNRPLVLPAAGRVKFEIVSGRDAGLSFDSQNTASLANGDEVLVQASSHRATFLHPHGWSYFGTLRRKLHWNEGEVA